ncbi:MAG: hypothetical protein JWM32_246 [Verrucomicrobia bacterium]|nr:hypothetical protein [Verrucomicrobiota bacterium]
MKFLGTLLILGATAVAVWFSLTTVTDSTLLAVCLVAVFMGGFLIVRERATEVFIAGVGTARAIVERVTADAQQVAEIKSRSEAQGATITMIAKEAEDSKILSETVRAKNKEADEKLRTVNETLQKALSSLRTLEATLEATNEYFSEAQLNMLGNPSAENELISTSPISQLLEGTYSVNGHAFTFNTDPEAENKFREAVRKFPKFPFSYWYLASTLIKKNDPLWRGYALQAVAILEKTSLVPGHHVNHDTALKQARAAVAHS